MSVYRTAQLLLDIRRAEKEGPIKLERRRATRLAAAVSHARTHSPYYRELYSGLPEYVGDTTTLPITDKKSLMGRFDDWVTDRDVSLERAVAFTDDPALVGTDFLGKYRVGTTSGSSGVRGIFVFDKRSTAVTSALALRSFKSWLRPADVRAIVRGGGRMAYVMALGGHFASSTVLPRSIVRDGKGSKTARGFSVFSPLPEIVDELNRFQPNILVGYAGQVALLAGEQEAGRLRISPRLVVLSAEGLTEQGYERIARVFDARIANSYSATEFMSAAVSCAHGWLHVNADWVILEPVDAEHRPVPAGEHSHTVLLTNLANRVQPILRYDLGDSVLTRPDPCPCGSPFTAIRIKGRSTEALTFHDVRSRAVGVPPGALALVVDMAPGLELAQVVQTSRTALSVRVKPARDADADHVWDNVRSEVHRFLGEHGLHNVEVTLDTDAPQQSAGGKYRLIIPLDEAREDVT